jgi:hypothetical protein
MLHLSLEGKGKEEGRRQKVEKGLFKTQNNPERFNAI